MPTQKLMNIMADTTDTTTKAKSDAPNVFQKFIRLKFYRCSYIDITIELHKDNIFFLILSYNFFVFKSN